MPTMDRDFATPLLPRVEFHIDRLKAAVVGGGAAVAGILIAYPPAVRQSLTAAPQEVCAAVIALSGATVLVAVGFYVLLRFLLWRGPAVVIDGFGIHDRRMGPIMTPWSRIHDVRVLDRHGRHIGIDTASAADALPYRSGPWPAPLEQRRVREPLAVIDTYFLRSITGNRILDFVMPLTALTPIDMSETPVSRETLSTDSKFVRGRLLRVGGFFVAVCLVPAVAAMTIIV